MDRVNNYSQYLIKELSLEDIYETIRIIDPIKKKIINYGKDSYEEDVNNCFAFWENKSGCTNCCSMRAFIEDRTCSKIQKSHGKTYFIVSKPINIENHRLVIEMIKDISQVILDYKINEEDYYINTNEEIVRDSTTGAYNRRFLDERIQTDILNAKNENKKLSIVLVNVNNLKAINKKYGHSTGDGVLAEIANKIDSLLESNIDWLARYGGDEFFVSMDGMGKMEAHKVAEEMREKVEKLKFNYKDEIFSTSINFGVSEISDDINSLEELMDSAEENLQMTRKSGKSSK